MLAARKFLLFSSSFFFLLYNVPKQCSVIIIWSKDRIRDINTTQEATDTDYSSYLKYSRNASWLSGGFTNLNNLVTKIAGITSSQTYISCQIHDLRDWQRKKAPHDPSLSECPPFPAVDKTNTLCHTKRKHIAFCPYL